MRSGLATNSTALEFSDHAIHNATMLNQKSHDAASAYQAFMLVIVLAVSILVPTRSATAQDNLIYAHCILGEAVSYCSIDPASTALGMIPHPQIGGIMSISRDGDHVALVAGQTVSISNIAS